MVYLAGATRLEDRRAHGERDRGDPGPERTVPMAWCDKGRGFPKLERT